MIRRDTAHLVGSTRRAPRRATDRARRRGPEHWRAERVARKGTTLTKDMFLNHLYGGMAIPKKRSKKNPLSATDTARNRAISSDRVPCENVIAMLKRFKIIADRYRNRRRIFSLRFFLIAAIYNIESACLQHTQISTAVQRAPC